MVFKKKMETKTSCWEGKNITPERKIKHTGGKKIWWVKPPRRLSKKTKEEKQKKYRKPAKG